MAKKSNIEADGLSPFATSLIKNLVNDKMPAKAAKPKNNLAMQLASLVPETPKSDSDGPITFEKSLTNFLDGGPDSIQRLAFAEDPTANNTYAGLYKHKHRLIPDTILKRIMIQDNLVASILTSRSNHISTFGRPRADRFGIGYVIEPHSGILEGMDEQQKKQLNDSIKEASSVFLNCGLTSGYGQEDQLTLSQYLFQSTRNALGLGRIATEIIWANKGGERVFHSFRPIDAGTIYRAAGQKSSAESVRQEALNLLERVKNKKLVPERFRNQEYQWVQVINGTPKQAFTSDECLVHNFYPVADVELDGYPVTPLDTVIAAVTTHINITNHNKMYFQSGRATRGMFVVNSDDIDEGTLKNIKQQFQAAINGVSNSWRTPFFAVGAEDKIAWVPIDSGGRDMEFQYLSDTNTREILSAFQMSPEELPGCAHLSKGSNSQSLSECLSPDTRVHIPSGMVTLGEHLCERQEAPITVWNGTEWKSGRVFKAGLKALRETELNSGIAVKTSPDHRFMVIGTNGTPEWRTQENLNVGDFVLVNKNMIDGDIKNVPSYKGRLLTPGMMEILGWITADGTLVDPRQRAGSKMQFFYHHEKEVDIWNRHIQIMEDFGLAPIQKKIFLSEEQRESIRQKQGFKDVAEFRLQNFLYDTDFYRFLQEIGFTSSTDGKCIPTSIHGYPLGYRQAFLRGFFSGDGGKLNKHGACNITIQQDDLREQTRLLLGGLGVRAALCKGIKRSTIKQNFKSYKSQKISKKIFIKDREHFWKQIGFIQNAKQRDNDKPMRPLSKLDLPDATRVYFAGKCKESSIYVEKKLPKMARDQINSWMTTTAKQRRCTLAQLKVRMAQCGVEEPEWLSNFWMEPVAELRDLDQVIDMVDVEIFGDNHAFIAEDMVVHNSNTEYQLTAARDVGLRPLLHQFQDFLNERIFPLIDKHLATMCTIKLVGLEAQTAEKESIRLQQDGPVHMTYDETLAKVEKKPVGKAFGGEFPFNPAWQAIADKYLTVGQILERFFGVSGASQDPQWAYVRDPFWWQFQQMQQQAQQMQAQAQAQQAGGQPGAHGNGPPPSGGGGGSAPPPGDSSGAPDPDQQQQSDNAQASRGGGLADAAAQASQALGKSEEQLSTASHRLMTQHTRLVTSLMDQWDTSAKQAIAEIMKTVKPSK